MVKVNVDVVVPPSSEKFAGPMVTVPFSMLPVTINDVFLIPVVSSLAYELIRFSANHPNNKPLRWLITPGLWMQGLTTREPTLEMLEVGIASLKPVLAADGHSWQENEQPDATQQTVMPGAVSPA